MIKTLTIRNFSPCNFDAVWDLHKVALQATGAFISDPALDKDLQNIQQEYQEKGGVFLVGFFDRKIIAMGALRKISHEIAEIKRMRVHPDFQRKGFGQQIYDELEKRARELKFKKLVLDTTTKQEAAQRMYIKNGFHEVRRDHQHGLEFIYFEKTL